VGRIRRGNYIFVVWVGDHGPRHVHVYRDGRLKLKWDLDNNLPIEGKNTRKLRRLLDELVQEGRL
jgi:hypothetical protein